jgi:hypothetical protein
MPSIENRSASGNVRSNGMLFTAMLCLLVLANTFVVYFISQEHYVYFWDWAVYWNSYIGFSNSLANEPAGALYNLLRSIQYDDYNLLPVLPLSPFAWMFGTARLPYILAITNVALLPGIGILGLVAMRSACEHSNLRQYIYWFLACAVIVLMPAMWAPVVRGWPDALGTVVIGLILLQIFFRPQEAQRLKQYLLVGIVLCLLVLVRRWYSYWAVAFFPAFVLAHAIDIHRRHGFAWRNYRALPLSAVIIGITFAVSLFIVAKPFMLKAMQTDYADIYSAYRFASSSVDSLKNLLAYYGWFQLLAAAVGLLWLIAKPESRGFGVFLLVHACLVFLMFTHTQDFAVQHHYLLAPTLAIGIAVLVIKMTIHITNRTSRAVILGLMFSGLIAGFSTVFFPGAAKITGMAGSLWPKIRTYPFSRDDMTELTGLVAHLEKLEEEEAGSIYVIASSDILNSSILQSACQADTTPRKFCACIGNTHDVDKRDGFPNQFLQATYIVVATPIQYHLRAEDQRVIGFLAHAVHDRHGIGASFERVSGKFALDRDVEVTVFRKVRPLNKEALDALSAQFIKHYPDRQDIFSIKGAGDKPIGQCNQPLP